MTSLSDIDVLGRVVFLRADLDVPLREAQVTNAQRLTTNTETATRLVNLKPTVDWLLEKGVDKIVIAGHIGRPSPRLRNGEPVIDPTLSTRQLLEPLEKILGMPILFQESVDSISGISRIQNDNHKIILLENLRFWPGETANSEDFADQLATLGDVYINEAFGNCHRAHASMVRLPTLMIHAAGLHLEEEIKILARLLREPQRPMVAVVGGAKLETKLPVVLNLAKVADYVLVGGEIAKELTIDNLQLTTDKKFQNKSKVKDQMSNVIVAALTPNTKDIGEDSIGQFVEIIDRAKTVVWNGPMGVFEQGFDYGSRAVAEAIVESGAFSVVGGGETTQYLGQLGLLSRFGFVSAGGGAMLEFLAGRELPGIKALG